MKKIKYIAIAAALLLGATQLSAKKTVVPRIYMFGFAASFNDTIVHFTDVQAVDNAWMDTKSKFLLGRDNYTYQLREYLTEQQQLPNRTCIVIFGEKRDQVEKKLLKLRTLYTTPKNKKKKRNKAQSGFDVRYIDQNQFKFQTVDMSDVYADEDVTVQPAKQPQPDKKKRKGGK